MGRVRPRLARLISLLALSVIAVCGLGGAWLWRVAWPDNGVRLTRVNVPVLNSGPCPRPRGPSPTGQAVTIVTEGVIDADVVSVLHRLTLQGWSAIDHMSESIKLIPSAATAVPLGIVHVRVVRGVSLAYTPERTTRLVASTTFVVCPS